LPAGIALAALATTAVASGISNTPVSKLVMSWVRAVVPAFTSMVISWVARVSRATSRSVRLDPEELAETGYAVSVSPV
jgi:hypothetical protein